MFSNFKFHNKTVVMMMHLCVLSMLVCLTGVLFMVFSPKKIGFSSSDSYPLFIKNRSWKEIGNETLIYPPLWVKNRNKVCTLSHQHKSLLCMLLLLCGDIGSLPGPIRHNKTIFFILSLKLFHQNVRGTENLI